MKSKFFSAERITDTATRIAGMGGELCYLIEGKEKALLIDGLSGVGSLKAFVRELTDLPVVMAVTHGHIDHVGAAWEYKECMINHRDIPLMYTERHSSPESRLRFVQAHAEKGMAFARPLLEDVIPPGAVRTYPIDEGDRIDIGGTQIEVIAVPGHTVGSVVFLNREERTVFAGDACNANTLLISGESSSIEEYAQSLKHVLRFKDYFDVLYGGHCKSPVPGRIIDDALALCGRILERTDDEEPFRMSDGRTVFFAARRGKDGMPENGSLANILYTRERIYSAGKTNY